MHRSGTSLAAQWLHTCNLHLGEKLYKASKFNPHGYYEDLDFLNLHRKVLQNHGIHPSGHENMPTFKTTSKELEEIQALIKKKARTFAWGWKEPRTCLFLNEYKMLLPDACYLVVFRDCQSVISSLLNRELTIKKRDGRNFIKNALHNAKNKKIKKQKIRQYCQIWIHYNNIIINNLEKHPRTLYTNYLNLQKQDKFIFERIRKWGYELNYTEFSKTFDKSIINQNNEQIVIPRQFRKTVREITEKFKTLSTQI